MEPIVSPVVSEVGLESYSDMVSRNLNIIRSEPRYRFVLEAFNVFFLSFSRDGYKFSHLQLECEDEDFCKRVANILKSLKPVICFGIVQSGTKIQLDTRTLENLSNLRNDNFRIRIFLQSELQKVLPTNFFSLAPECIPPEILPPTRQKNPICDNTMIKSLEVLEDVQSRNLQRIQRDPRYYFVLEIFNKFFDQYRPPKYLKLICEGNELRERVRLVLIHIVPGIELPSKLHDYGEFTIPKVYMESVANILHKTILPNANAPESINVLEFAPECIHSDFVPLPRKLQRQVKEMKVELRGMKREMAAFREDVTAILQYVFPLVQVNQEEGLARLRWNTPSQEGDAATEVDRAVKRPRFKAGRYHLDAKSEISAAE